MWSQSLPDTQNAREEIFSQEYENANIWGRLYATKDKFPCLGTFVWYWPLFQFLNLIHGW
jgi:hypothetical protein